MCVDLRILKSGNKILFLALGNKTEASGNGHFPPGMYLWRPLDGRPVLPQSRSRRDGKRQIQVRFFPAHAVMHTREAEV